MTKDFKLEADTPTPREQGMKAFDDDKHFGECPNEGFKPEDLEWRWQWQKGWLRAQLEKQDADKKLKEQHAQKIAQ